MLADAFTHRFHDLQIDADQVVTAHARLPGNTGRDDADVGARDVGIVIGTLEGDVRADDGGGLGDVQRLALGRALGNVEQDDVAQRFARSHVGQGAADHAGADKGDLRASHQVSPLAYRAFALLEAILMGDWDNVAAV